MTKKYPNFIVEINYYVDVNRSYKIGIFKQPIREL